MRAWRRWITTRRSLRTLDRLATAVEQQNVLLGRLVEHLAPVVAVTPVSPREPSVDYFDPEEARQVEAYRQRVFAQTGRWVTEDESLAHLAELATMAGWRRATPPPERRD